MCEPTIISDLGWHRSDGTPRTSRRGWREGMMIWVVIFKGFALNLLHSTISIFVSLLFLFIFPGRWWRRWTQRSPRWTSECFHDYVADFKCLHTWQGFQVFRIWPLCELSCTVVLFTYHNYYVVHWWRGKKRRACSKKKNKGRKFMSGRNSCQKETSYQCCIYIQYLSRDIFFLNLLNTNIQVQ